MQTYNSAALSSRPWYFYSLTERVFRFGLILILFVTLFNLPLRYFLGTREGVPAFLFIFQTILFFLLMAVLSFSGPVPVTSYDKITTLFLIYGVFHVVFAVYRGEQVIYAFREFRSYFSGFMLYYIVRYYLQRTRDFASILRCIQWVIFFSCAEYLYEAIGILVFQQDIQTLAPWISVLEKVSDKVSWIYSSDSTAWAYIAKKNYYFLSLFGTQHSVGLIAAVGVALFYAQYKATNYASNIFWMVLSAIMVFAVTSRTFIFALLLILGCIAYYERRKIFRAIPAFFVFGAIPAFALILAYFNVGAFRNFFDIYWEVMKNQTIAFFIKGDAFNFIPAPGAGLALNIFYYLFGIGINERFMEFNEVPMGLVKYTYYKIEIGLLPLAFQYGLVYLFLLGYTATLILFLRKNRVLRFYSLALIPFYVSLVHYVEILKLGVIPVFVFLYAWLVTAWEVLAQKEKSFLFETYLKEKNQGD